MTKNGYLTKFRSVPEVRWLSGLGYWRSFGRFWIRLPPTAFLRIMGYYGLYFVSLPILVLHHFRELPKMVLHQNREVFVSLHNLKQKMTRNGYLLKLSTAQILVGNTSQLKG